MSYKEYLELAVLRRRLALLEMKVSEDEDAERSIANFDKHLGFRDVCDLESTIATLRRLPSVVNEDE